MRAKRPNLYLVFRVSAQQAAVNADKNVMLTRAVERAKRWLRDWVFVSSEAIADGNDSPPMPMGGLGEGTAKSGGCFIATTAFGSPLARHVQVLKDFRDCYLMNFSLGRAFVKAYYRYSPPIADRIAKSDNLRALIRISLLPLIGVSWVALKVGLTPTLGFVLLLWCGMFFMIRIRRKRR